MTTRQIKFQPFREEDLRLINDYISHLRERKNDKLCCALVHFLSKYSSSSESVINKRKTFILKVLKECTVSCNLNISLFPKEVEDKLIEAYETDIKKENEANKAHIAELVAEMNEIF